MRRGSGRYFMSRGRGSLAGARLLGALSSLDAGPLHPVAGAPGVQDAVVRGLEGRAGEDLVDVDEGPAAWKGGDVARPGLSIGFGEAGGEDADGSRAARDVQVAQDQV